MSEKMLKNFQKMLKKFLKNFKNVSLCDSMYTVVDHIVHALNSRICIVRVSQKKQIRKKCPKNFQKNFAKIFRTISKNSNKDIN